MRHTSNQVRYRSDVTTAEATPQQSLGSGRRNIGVDVYSEARNRMAWIFDNFERVYLSFSGGKDSGVLLNLALQHMEAAGETRKLGIQILDNEANYEQSLEFMHRMMREHGDKLDIYWCCMPITLPCTVSSYAVDWQCWGQNDKDRWVRPMPTDPYIVNIDNHPFDFFRENMNYDDFWTAFLSGTRRAKHAPT